MTLLVVGQRFGALTVLEVSLPHLEPSGRRTSRVHVRCDCEREFTLDTRSLLRGQRHCRTCAHNTRSKYHIGDRYDQLVIQDFEYVGRTRVAICKCDCGNTTKLPATLLGSNKTGNCGCRPRGLWKGVGDLSASVFYRLKRSAQVRHIPFRVTKCQLWELFLYQNRKCALTDQDIVLSLASRKAGTASLDRKNNRRGYFMDNVQWVHKDVNLMKSNFTQEYYVTLCHLVTEHTRAGG